MVERSKGQNNNIPLTKKASQAFTNLEVVTLDANGFVIPAVTASTVIAGLVQRDVTTASQDYASANTIVVDCPRGDRDEFIIDVTGGTATQANVGKFYDLADSKTLNIAAAGTVKHAMVVGIVSGTKVAVSFNRAVLV